VEALARWEHPRRGLVSPTEFIPVAEHAGIIKPLTLLALETALSDRQSMLFRPLGVRPVAVNLSARMLEDEHFPDDVTGLLERYGIPRGGLCLELTESSIMADPARSQAMLERLSEAGVRLSIDDFGTGYSSLSHLKRLPIDEIKVDRSFVTHMHQNSNDFMIVRATVELGRNLGLLVVAEGVEDLEAFDRLADFGCDEAQGYYISRPLSAVEFTRWLSVRNLEMDTVMPDGRRESDQRDDPGRERLRVV